LNLRAARWGGGQSAKGSGVIEDWEARLGTRKVIDVDALKIHVYVEGKGIGRSGFGVAGKSVL